MGHVCYFYPRYLWLNCILLEYLPVVFIGERVEMPLYIMDDVFNSLVHRSAPVSCFL